MKIELTKKEWNFLRSFSFMALTTKYEYYGSEANLPMCKEMATDLMNKLGDEWKDDDEIS